MTAMQCLLFGAFCFYVRYVCAVNMLSNWTAVLLCGPCLCIRHVEHSRLLRHLEGHGFQALPTASYQMLSVSMQGRSGCKSFHFTHLWPVMHAMCSF